MTFDHRFSSAQLQLRSVVLAAAVAVGTGCAPKTAVLSDPNPSDPMAREGVAAPYRPTLGDAPARTDEADPAAPVADPHAGHGHTPEDVVFACPMHPDVTGAEGDKCHLCGMTLVPKKEPPK